MRGARLDAPGSARVEVYRGTCPNRPPPRVKRMRAPVYLTASHAARSSAPLTMFFVP